LHFTAFYGHLRIVKLLLEHGTDVNTKDGDGYIPLNIVTIKEANLEIAKLLLEKGAKVITQDIYEMIRL